MAEREGKSEFLLSPELNSSRFRTIRRRCLCRVTVTFATRTLAQTPTHLRHYLDRQLPTCAHTFARSSCAHMLTWVLAIVRVLVARRLRRLDLPQFQFLNRQREDKTCNFRCSVFYVVTIVVLCPRGTEPVRVIDTIYFGLYSPHRHRLNQRRFGLPTIKYCKGLPVHR